MNNNEIKEAANEAFNKWFSALSTNQKHNPISIVVYDGFIAGYNYTNEKCQEEIKRLKKDKGFENTLFDFSSAMSTAIEQYKDVLYFAAETVSEKEALQRKLSEALNYIRKGITYSGHFSDCTQEHDDEPCSCGADIFEHDATMFIGMIND